MHLILASTSIYRRSLLARLGLSCESVDPKVDEIGQLHESPRALAQRLARAKAEAVARRFPDSLVIGGDQVACCADRILHKPGSASAQAEQLMYAQGRELQFLTAICLMRHADGRSFQHLDVTECRMRPLDSAAITRYVDAEPAWDCAGGFKVEGLGICLFEAIRSEDPSALIGLPLIALARGLREFGWAVP